MRNGDVGNVSGGGATQWNRKLAEELDLADGKKDGKISSSVWNGFIKHSGSNGNKIKWAISVDNAAKSFSYYDAKKDEGKVDWGNWESLYKSYKSELNGAEQPKFQYTIPEKPVKVSSNDVERPTFSNLSTNETSQISSQQQANFEKMMKDVSLPATLSDIKNLLTDGWKQSYAEKRLFGDYAYTNDEGAKLSVSDSRAESPLDNSAEFFTTVTYNDGKNLQNSIRYDKDGKALQGTLIVKQEDGTSVKYNYTYDESGNKVLQSSNLLKPEAAQSAVQQMEAAGVSVGADTLQLQHVAQNALQDGISSLLQPTNISSLNNIKPDDNLNFIGDKIMNYQGNPEEPGEEELSVYSGIILTDEQEEEAQALFRDLYTYAPVKAIEDGSLGVVYQKGPLLLYSESSAEKMSPRAQGIAKFLVAGKQRFLELLDGKDLKTVMSQTPSGELLKNWEFFLSYANLLEASNIEIGKDGKFTNLS